jgi:NADH-quinone oxidoreductase subunit N
MSDADLLALSPYIALAATAVVVMLVSAFFGSHRLLLGLTLAGLAAAFACVLIVAESGARRATTLLRVDGLSLYFTGLLVIVTVAAVAVAYGYLKKTERRQGDFYVLVTLATLGAVVLLASTHFASLFLGLEVLTVSLYGLIAYPRARLAATEAGFKYLVLAGTTSAFLLFGMALVYAVTGTMVLSSLTGAATGLSGWEAVAYRVGWVLVFTGIGFKLALVPFHMWTPDVYQGGPAPTTAFLATVSKAAVFVVLLRFVAPLDLRRGGVLLIVFTIVAYASMLAGNLLALRQQNVKRLLAYSSIAQLGYLLVALIASGGDGRTAVAFYLSVYSLALVAAFGVVAILSRSGGEPESLSEYRGLGHRRPLLAIVLTVSMLSLAGMPLTAGFIAKFLVIRAGAGASLWGLLIVLALTSAMSLYYYLRVVITMFRVDAAPFAADLAAPWSPPPTDRLAGVAVAVLSVATIVLGVYPAPLLHLIDQALAGVR